MNLLLVFMFIYSIHLMFFIKIYCIAIYDCKFLKYERYKINVFVK